MLAVRRIYDGKSVRIIDRITEKKRYRVVVTFIEELSQNDNDLRDFSAQTSGLDFWEDSKQEKRISLEGIWYSNHIYHGGWAKRMKRSFILTDAGFWIGLLDISQVNSCFFYRNIHLIKLFDIF